MSPKAKLSALKRLAENALDGHDLPDLRQEKAIREIPVLVDESTMTVITQVFQGTTFMEDPDKVRLLLSVHSEVRAEWASARDSFLAIGKALLLLQSKLTKAEIRRLKEGSERLFPFGEAVASQLRKVAAAVGEGRIPLSECPGSYATAYLLTTLDDRELEQARAARIMRIDVTRAEVAEFRRRVRRGNGEESAIPKSTVTLPELRAEYRALTEQVRTLLLEARQKQQRRHEIARLITG